MNDICKALDGLGGASLEALPKMLEKDFGWSKRSKPLKNVLDYIKPNK